MLIWVLKLDLDVSSARCACLDIGSISVVFFALIFIYLFFLFKRFLFHSSEPLVNLYENFGIMYDVVNIFMKFLI